MTDTDLNGASTEADGTIVLSGTSNADLFDKHFASSLDAATQTVLPGGTPD
jgi:hypothetical protein